MSKQGSNSELFAHENNALTARPQLHNLKSFQNINTMADKKETKVAENENFITEFEKEEALWNVKLL